MSGGELSLGPGSRLPRDAAEMDVLLRRVPEIAFFPELDSSLFEPQALAQNSGQGHRARIVELADAAYLGRLEQALGKLAARAEREQNGGLTFIVASLQHFVTSLPPERHPLVVALYFRSCSLRDASMARPDVVARLMDDYDHELNA